MAKIALLDQNTINKIAAGEVVERPASVVKELVENAIDAGANAITAEIKDGGISFIRITDNGCGIAKEDIPTAFLRHSTSKIKSVEDLLTVGSLGFRGEALSSISAVAQVELITKTREDFTGTHFEIHGGQKKDLSDIGCPEGTTFIVRNLFYNTPARQKFLKTAMTEAGYISDCMERLAISHPEIAFKFINNNKTVFYTSGNTRLKEDIYSIYGRDIASQLTEVDYTDEFVSINGYIAKPVVSRGNRNFENYFINGRYIKSTIITKAIEEAYKPYTMQHKYPFTCMHFKIPQDMIDVNVHPAKMEIRLYNGDKIYYAILNAIKTALSGKSLIPAADVGEEKKSNKKSFVKESIPEPFENKRLMKAAEKSSNVINSSRNTSDFADTEIGRLSFVAENPSEQIKERPKLKGMLLKDESDISKNYESSKAETEAKALQDSESRIAETEAKALQDSKSRIAETEAKALQAGESRIEKALRDDEKTENENTSENDAKNTVYQEDKKPEIKQETLFEADEENGKAAFLDIKSVKRHKIIGQLFLTYWLVEFDNQLYIIDQHAAHEKILYERTMKRLKDKEYLSQMISPPAVVSLSIKEAEVLEKYGGMLKQLGFGIEHFGGREYLVNAVPADMCGIDGKVLLTEIIDELINDIPAGTPDIILEKVASMSCKAAVKGNYRLSVMEAQALIDDLMQLENPFHCPHGRPVIISMTKYEIEKKFKRIV